MGNMTMKAAVVEPNGALIIRDIPIPAYGPYQALVKLVYGATCGGTDQRIMDGGHPRPLPFPAILGHESVGRVLETGDRVRFLQAGDLISRVGAPPFPELGLHICWGGFAQYGIATDWQAMEQDGIPPSEWEKARVQQVIPIDIDQRTAPMFITWRETLSYHNRLGIKAGDQVLIIGSGANALAFTCHCAYTGASAVVLGSTARAEQFRSAGAAAVIGYKDPAYEGALTAACPRGIDHIIDAIGVSGMVNSALPFLNKNGQIGVYGWHKRNDYGLDPFAAAASFRVYCGGYDEAETHDQVIARVREGVLRGDAFYDLDRPVPLANLASAYQDLAQRKALKYLIDLS